MGKLADAPKVSIRDLTHAEKSSQTNSQVIKGNPSNKLPNQLVRKNCRRDVQNVFIT